MVLQSMKLLIDSREKSESLIALIIDRCVETDVKYETVQLTVGDFVWENAETGAHVIAIEHKSTEDFIASVRNGKLNGQVMDLQKNEYPYYALFIDGKWDVGYSRRWGRPFTKTQRDGKLLSLVVRDKIPVMEFASEVEMVDGLFNLPELISRRDGVNPELVERHTCLATKGKPNLIMYFNLPRVGLTSAQELETRYGPMLNLLTMWRRDRILVERKEITKKAFYEIYPKRLLPKPAQDALDELSFKDGVVV